MSTAIATPTATGAAAVRPRRLLTAAGVALALNLAAFAAGSLAGASWSVGQPYPIAWMAVLVATLVAFTVGGLATWLAARWRPGLQRVAAWAGLALGLVSMVSLLNAADLATGLALGVMHLMAAGLWFAAARPTPAVSR